MLKKTMLRAFSPGRRARERAEAHDGHSPANTPFAGVHAPVSPRAWADVSPELRW
jgi:hypothetical protein